MKKEIIMSIGLPFSGKSTLAKEYEANGWKVIKRDNLLEEIVSSTEFTEAVNDAIRNSNHHMDENRLFAIRNEIAIQMLTHKVQEEIRNTESVAFFYDGTNLQRKSREGILAMRDEGYDIKAIYLNLPMEEILRRAQESYAKDERRGEFNYQAFVNLERMNSMLESPTLEEGFTEIERIVEEPEGNEFNRELRESGMGRLR